MAERVTFINNNIDLNISAKIDKSKILSNKVSHSSQHGPKSFFL